MDVYSTSVDKLLLLDADDARSLKPLQCIAACHDVALALKRLHDHDMHHMDLKPANILLDGSKLILADFDFSQDKGGDDPTEFCQMFVPKLLNGIFGTERNVRFALKRRDLTLSGENASEKFEFLAKVFSAMFDQFRWYGIPNPENKIKEITKTLKVFFENAESR